MNILTNFDFNHNQVQNAVIHPLGTAPSNPNEGQIYYDSSIGKKLLYIYNGTEWISAGGAYSLPTASADTLGGIKVGTGLSITDGVLSATYSHPTGDGNLHVPANSTTNSGKVLTASDTAGTYTWETPIVYEAVIALGSANQIWGINNAGTAKEWKSFSTPGTTGTAPNWALSIANQINLNIPMASAENVTAGLISKVSYDSFAGAASLSHTQNTDTGTTASSFAIDSDGTTNGVLIKTSSGELQLRNLIDAAYADLRVKNLYVEGTTFTIEAETIELADNVILLNSNITTSSGNANGGIAVKRLMADDVTRKDAELYYDISTERWTTISGAVTGTLVTLPLTNKYTIAVGNASDTSFVITHNLNTRDAIVAIRETASDYELVVADVEYTSLTTVTIRFAVAPTSNQYTVTVIG